MLRSGLPSDGLKKEGRRRNSNRTFDEEDVVLVILVALRTEENDFSGVPVSQWNATITFTHDMGL